MSAQPLTDQQLQILTSLVEGYKAREGMKDRIRALNEWEIARRAGATEASYAEFFDHPSREAVLNALFALQRQGLVEVWERGVKYDTFVPTAKGEAYVAGERDSPEAQVVSAPLAEPVNGPVSAGTMGNDNLDPVIQRLDEIIRLLRSLDGKRSGF